MIQKTVKEYDLPTYDEIAENLRYWLGKSPEERVSAVEILRRQHYHGDTPRLQRIARVIQRPQG